MKCLINSLIVGLFVLLAISSFTGCQLAGWIAQGVTPEQGPAEIQPEYQGLIGKSVAVMVATDERSVSPDTASKICQYISSRLAVEVRDIRIVDPKQVAKFIKENPDWIAIPHGDLVKEMKVERIVYIDVAQYTTHEPGNKELWQGILNARINVIDAEAKNPHVFAYTTDQQVQYPPDQPMGMLRGNDEMIQKGLLTAFSDRLAALFREERPK